MVLLQLPLHKYNMECIVFMGEDVVRKPNVDRMKLLGAVVPVSSGSKLLKMH